METIGDRIRIVAEYFGSLKDLAEGLDMTTQSLNSYLVGKREPGAKVLSKLAKLGCNIHWVLTGEGEMLVNSQQMLILEEPPRIHPDDIELIANNVFEKFKELFTINLTKSTN